MSQELLELAETIPLSPAKPPPDPEVELQVNEVDENGKRKYSSHRRKNIFTAMIDFLIANPTAKSSEIGAAFGYSTVYVSRLINSDIFQAQLKERRAEIVNPGLTSAVQERLTGLLAQSADIVAEELERTNNPKLAITTMGILVKASQFGAKAGPTVNVAQYVAVVPEKSRDVEAWAANHAPGRVIEGEQG